MINITRGEKKTFTIKIRDQNGDAFDLTNFPNYKVCLPLMEGTNKLEITNVANANGSIVSLLGAATQGKLQVVVGFVDTDLLQEGEGQDIGVVLNTVAEDDPRPKNGSGVLNVFPPVC